MSSHYQPTGLLLVPLSTTVAIGCAVSGPGIQPGTTVTAITPTYNTTNTSIQWLQITLSIVPWVGSVVPTGVVNNGFYSSSTLTNLTLGYSSTIYFTCNQSNQVAVSGINETSGETLSFKEDTKGWVSFKSFVQENGISLNNAYYTFKDGDMYAHNVNATRNMFYGNQFDSSVDVIFNKAPGIIKSFSTLNYEGSQSRVTPEINNNPDYYDNFTKAGWYIESMISNSQELGELEFWDKEDKWFSQIKGVKTEWLSDGTAGNIDPREFSYQGIGNSDLVTCVGCPTFDCSTGSCQAIFSGLPGIYPTLSDCIAACIPPTWNCVGYACVDPLDGSGVYTDIADCNSNCFVPSWDCTGGSAYVVPTGPLAGQTISPHTCFDPGTGFGAHASLTACQSNCVAPPSWDCVSGNCIDPGTGNGAYASLINCQLNCPAITPGCTDATACNYNILATVDDGSCELPDGCTDPTATNFNPSALCDDGSCTYGTPGCTDITACNFDIAATVDDGSCIGLLGCMTATACNHDAAATCDDGSCFGLLGCTDPTATNYLPAATCDDGSCTGCDYGCTDLTACNYDPLATCDDGSCNTIIGCTHGSATNYDPTATCDCDAMGTGYGNNECCTYNLLFVPDDNFQAWLEAPTGWSGANYAPGFDKSFSSPDWAFGYKVGYMTPNSNFNLEELRLTGLSVTDFTGLEGMSKLRIFECENCGMTDIQVSSTITQLQKFGFWGQLKLDNNNLTTLDLSNPAFTGSVISSVANPYKSIDVSNNSITSINLTNPWHSCAAGACGGSSGGGDIGLGTLNATGNPAMVIKVPQDDLDAFNLDSIITGSSGTIIGKATILGNPCVGMGCYWITPAGSTVVGCPPLTVC